MTYFWATVQFVCAHWTEIMIIYSDYLLKRKKICAREWRHGEIEKVSSRFSRATNYLQWDSTKKIAWSWLTPDQESPIYLDFISNNHKAKQQVNYTNPKHSPTRKKFKKFFHSKTEK